MSDANLPIGVFDSGVGGLTVVQALIKLLPQENIIYLGDTARLPYGTKSAASVQRYAGHAAEYLVDRGIKLLVVACNTASAVALDHLRETLQPLPVIGVVEPGAAAAVSISKRQKHLVLATEATTARKAYSRTIRALQPAAEVEELPCSVFVALAEEGWHSGPVAETVANEYLSAVRQRPDEDMPDTAILGCTHFPLLRAAIATALGPDIHIVDSATTTAQAVRDELEQLALLAGPGSEGKLSLVATDGAERFADVGGRFLGRGFAPADISLIDIHPADLTG